MEKNIRPKISCVIPIHDMKGGADFLWKTINSLMEQTFQDFEIVIVKEGTMPENTNAGIKRARGELIKILYLDDHLAHKDALKDIVEAMDANKDKNWLITGVNNNIYPYWTNDINTGNNKLGSPSALTIRNGLNVYFDEKLTWLLDVVLYIELYKKYGPPIILNGVNVIIGIHDGQMTNLISDERKKQEHEYTKNISI